MQQHRHADTDREPVDGSDNWLLRIGEVFEETLHMRFLRRLLVHRRCARLGKVTQIIASREGATGTGVKRHTDFRVCIGIFNRVGQRLVHLRRQRVFLVGTVHGDDLDAIFNAHKHMVGHGKSLC